MCLSLSRQIAAAASAAIRVARLSAGQTPYRERPAIVSSADLADRDLHIAT